MERSPERGPEAVQWPGSVHDLPRASFAAVPAIPTHYRQRTGRMYGLSPELAVGVDGGFLVTGGELLCQHAIFTTATGQGKHGERGVS